MRLDIDIGKEEADNQSALAKGGQDLDTASEWLMMLKRTRRRTLKAMRIQRRGNLQMRIRYKAFRGYKIKTMMVGLTLRIVLSYLDYPSVSPSFFRLR